MVGCIKLFFEKIIGIRCDCLELVRMFDYLCFGDVVIVIRLDCLVCSICDLLDIVECI